MQAMHDRYASTWYHTLTFKQKTTLGLPSGGEIVQTWYEAGELPGRLRIDTDLASKAGVLFARDSIYNFSGGKLVRADTGLNELLVLGFDVYAQSVGAHRIGAARTRLRPEPVSRRHVAGNAGVRRRRGARRHDVEAVLGRARPAAVRAHVRERPRRAIPTYDSASTCRPAAGGWPTEVTQLVNGKRRILEQYSDVRTDVDLADALFDPRRWASSPHWAVP